MMDRETKKMLLYIGEPQPQSPHYPLSTVDLLVNSTKQEKEEAAIEYKERRKIHIRFMKEYWIKRRKEIKELNKNVEGGNKL